MSLIQAALDKTQNKISAPPEQNQPGVKHAPHIDALHGLGAIDREVEKKIQETNKKEPRQVFAKKKSGFLFTMLGLLFISGVIYWSQNRLEVEAEPPLIVSIERHNLPAKPQLALPPAAQKTFLPVLSPTDSRGLFNLSGIAWGGAEPYAVINGQILRSGEMVEKKALVQNIEKDHVVLNYRGETIRLTLKR